MKKKWKFRKYKKINKQCKACRGNGYWLSVATSCEYWEYYDKHRCGCSLKPRKKYLKAKDKSKFWDNHADCNSKNFSYDKPF